MPILNNPLAVRGDFNGGDLNSFIKEDAATLPSVHKVTSRADLSCDTRGMIHASLMLPSDYEYLIDCGKHTVLDG